MTTPKIKMVREELRAWLSDMEALKAWMGTSGGEGFEAAFGTARKQALASAAKYIEAVEAETASAPKG